MALKEFMLARTMKWRGRDVDIGSSRFADDFPMVNQHAADGDASLGKSVARLLKCRLHEWIHALEYADVGPMRRIFVRIGTEIA